MDGSTGVRVARVAVLAAAAGVAITALQRARRRPPALQRRAGTSAGGMEFVALGDGTRTMLGIPGGPGSDIQAGLMARMIEGQARPYADAGYTVWTVTRRRNMPSGHTVADMAADHARFIHEQLGGRVDVVLGVSYGGIIALYLAANHPEVVRHVVIVAAAATISERGKELDLRWARLRAEGRYAEAGAAMLEYVMPGPRFGGLRRLAGRAVGPVLAKIRTPAADLLVEGEAEFAYDARDVLGRITVPVLLVCGDADLFFPRAAVEETAAGIPDSSLVLYPGLGHARTAANRRVPRDVLDWLARREAVARDRG